MSRVAFRSIAVVFVLVACGGGGGSSPDASVDAGDPPDAAVPPSVLSTWPADDASGVEPGVLIAARFSDAMDPATLTASTVRVTLEGSPVDGTVRYDPDTREVSFFTRRLALRGAYHASITTGAVATSGLALEAPVEWDFTVRDGIWSAPQRLELDDTGDARDPQVAFDGAGNARAVWQAAGGIEGNRRVAGGTFALTSAALSTARYGHTATLLPSGRVLILGGGAFPGDTPPPEWFDPDAGTFSPVSGAPVAARLYHTATRLRSGKVLVVGGYGDAGLVATAELYDPATDSFVATAGAPAVARSGHTATLLASGEVLIVGGFAADGATAMVEIYDPVADAFVTTGSLEVGRHEHTATLLASGQVLVVGGFGHVEPGNDTQRLDSAELYDRDAGTFTMVSDVLAVARGSHTATLLPSGRVLIAGGNSALGAVATAELFDPGAGAFTSTVGMLAVPRLEHTATLLASGHVLVVGGSGPSGRILECEVFDPASGVFSPTAGRPDTVREYHTATRLLSGEVLVAAGIGAPDYLATAERFDPSGAQWGAPGPVAAATSAARPALSVDTSGDALAIWDHVDVTRRDVSAARFEVGSGWGAAQLVETGDAGDAQAPQVAMDAGGDAFVVWQQSDGTRDSIWARRFSVAAGWGDAERIDTSDAGSATDPQVAVNASGGAVVVWQQSDGTRDNIWASRFDVGTGWSDAALIETADAGSAHDPQVGIDDAGNAIAVWYQDGGASFQAWTNRTAVGSGWGTAQRLVDDPNVYAPQVAVDAAGNAIATWHHNDGVRDNLWARRFAVDTGWGDPGLVETDDAGNAVGARLSVDGAGRAVAVWYQSDGTAWNVWANTFVAATGWGTAGLVEASPGDAFAAQVAIGRGGDAVAVWHQRDGTHDTVWSSVLH